MVSVTGNLLAFGRASVAQKSICGTKVHFFRPKWTMRTYLLENVLSFFTKDSDISNVGAIHKRLKDFSRWPMTDCSGRRTPRARRNFTAVGFIFPHFKESREKTQRSSDFVRLWCALRMDLGDRPIGTNCAFRMSVVAARTALRRCAADADCRHHLAASCRYRGRTRCRNHCPSFWG